MTKTLTLLRHLKSSWDHPDLDDFDRPLNARGKNAGPLVSLALVQRCPKPDFVLCSPAARTRATLAYTLHQWPDLKVQFDPKIYESRVDTLLRQIAACGDANHVQHLLVIGHNPGLLDLLWRLGPPDTPTAPIYQKFPTGAVASLELSGDTWSDALQTTGQVQALFTPKSLKNEIRLN